MAKKYFNQLSDKIIDPFTGVKKRVIDLFQGNGQINKSYQMDNHVAVYILNNLIKKQSNLLFNYVKNIPIKQFGNKKLSCFIDESMFRDILLNYEYEFDIINNLAILKSNHNENFERFTLIVDLIVYFINNNLQNHITDHTEIFEYFLSKTNGIIGYPNYVVNNYFTTENISHYFMDSHHYTILSTKVDNLEISNFKGDLEIWGEQKAVLNIQFSLTKSKKVFFIDFDLKELEAKVKKYIKCNYSVVKAMMLDLETNFLKSRIQLYNNQNHYIDFGKKYNYNNGHRYTLIEVLQIDSSYIFWCIKNLKSLIIRNPDSYIKYIFPLEDDMLYYYIFNQIKQRFYDNFFEEEPEPDYTWTNESLWEFDEDNYWNID